MPYRTREHEWIAIYRLGGPSLMSLPVNLDFKQATCLCYIPDVYQRTCPKLPHWKGPTVTSSINTRSAARILGRRVANVPKPCHVPLTYGRYRTVTRLTKYLIRGAKLDFILREKLESCINHSIPNHVDTRQLWYPLRYLS